MQLVYCISQLSTFFGIIYWCDSCWFCDYSKTWDVLPVHPLYLWFAISKCLALFLPYLFSTRKSRDSIALGFSDLFRSLKLVGLKHSWSCSCFISLNSAPCPCIQTSWCLFVGCRSPRAVWHFSFLELHHCLCMCNLLMLSILLMLLLLGWSGYVANLLCVPSTCELSSLLDLILSGLIFLCLTHFTLYSLVLESVLVVVVLVLEWRPVDLEF